MPANNAFGGWVYGGRIPMLGVDQIEVVRGGGSSVWGNYALGGVVQVLSRRPTERGLFFDASYGTQETMNFDLLQQEAAGLDLQRPGRAFGDARGIVLRVRLLQL